MASTAPLGPGTVTNVARTDPTFGVGQTWANPINAKVSDNVFATVYLDNPPSVTAVSAYLWAVNFNPAIAANAVITGIQCRVQAKRNVTGGVGSIYCQPIKAGVLAGNERTITTSVTTFNTFYSTGGDGDTMGLMGLLGNNVNDINFGMAVRVFENTTDTFSIDFIELTFFYYIPVTQTASDSLTIGEATALTTTTYNYSIVNNNMAYILNMKTGGWTKQTLCPFTRVIFRPRIKQLYGTRRDLGQISVVNSGNTYDGTNINSKLQTGYFDFGQNDEDPVMAEIESEAIKRLRVHQAEVRGQGNLTLTVLTENDSVGQSFTITPLVVDNVTYNIVRTTLSRVIRGKLVSFQISNSNGQDFWIGNQSLRIKPKALK